jgi:ferrochelatase
LFSYHGVQSVTFAKQTLQSHCKIDGSCCNTPSPAHVSVTKPKQVVKLLGIPEGKYSQTFQSRLAGDKATLHGCSRTKCQKRNKKLAVVTPAFVSDCLETLEEIAMEANHEFKVHGGEEAVPCLNDGDMGATVR